jgi:hypothetical protein
MGLARQRRTEANQGDLHGFAHTHTHTNVEHDRSTMPHTEAAG